MDTNISTKTVAASAGVTMPRIGQPLADGIFAGICRGEEGDHALVLLAAAPKRLKWAAAMKWAEGQGDGVTLPTRAEQSILFGNLKDQFPEGGWYWSCEQYAGGEAYAWYQNFTYGAQDGYHKGNELRARAVRRLPLLTL
jgi:hypothetical protein